MCGIAGFTRFKRPVGNVEALLAMGDAIAHRGPDAHGEYLENAVGLCHRRLAIVDLSEAGVQPMHSQDQNIVLVFNGEIYNFLELREVLEASGYVFRTQTDTEVIIALYQTEGEGFISKLNGMFAFALWDKRKQSLLLARDRVGKKPLYFYQDDSCFAFASELKALNALAATGASLELHIRHDAIHDFFAYQYIPDPKTIYTKVHKLEPGHTLCVTAKGIVKRKYWDISFAQATSKTEAEYKDEIMEIISQATKQRMLADVPLGAFLSGGVDSSGIVALMATQTDDPVTTCSIGFDDKKFNETEFAKVVAEQYKTSHHELTVTANVKDQLKKIVRYFDEPFADPSLVPTYFVSELARQKVTVALAGDGGDEVFAGYEKYLRDYYENRLRGLFPEFIRRSLFASASDVLQHSGVNLFRRAGSLLGSLAQDPAKGFYISNSFIRDDFWRNIASTETLTKLAGYHPSQVTTDHYHASDAQDHLGKVLYTDMKTYLPGGILVKVDRMSMANSLEVRAPLLDYQVMEYAAKMPSSLKLNSGEKKYLLKECFKPLLPNDILYRKKMGFSVPLASWLRDAVREIAEQSLFSPNSVVDAFFDRDAVTKVWQEHLSGRYDHSSPLWSLLMFSLWFENYGEALHA